MNDMGSGRMEAGTSCLSNVEAEATLLGALLNANGLIDSAADVLDSDDFFLVEHKAIFQAITDFAARGRQASPVTLKSLFQDGLEALGGPAYLARITGDVLSGLISIKDTAEQISDLAERRKIYNGLLDATADCLNPSIPNAEIASRADGALTVSKRDSIHQPSGGECLDELIESYADRRSGVTCQTIPALDSLLGPMRPKQLVIGAGRPGMGKTAFAISYALGAAQAGHGVLFVSLEMSSTELAARMASDLCYDRAPVPFSKIRDGTLNPDEMAEIRNAQKFMHGLPLRVVDTGNLSAGRLARIVRSNRRKMEAQGQTLDLVIVDYLQLLSPDQRHRSSYESISDISRSLKAMAKDLNIAVLALAQLSRAVESRTDKRPMLSDLRDSGQIEQDADAVLFLLRDEYYHRQNEPEPYSEERARWEQTMTAVQGGIEFILAKRRNGATGSAKGKFYSSFQAVRS